MFSVFQFRKFTTQLFSYKWNQTQQWHIIIFQSQIDLFGNFIYEKDSTRFNRNMHVLGHTIYWKESSNCCIKPRIHGIQTPGLQLFHQPKSWSGNNQMFKSKYFCQYRCTQTEWLFQVCVKLWAESFSLKPLQFFQSLTLCFSFHINARQKFNNQLTFDFTAFPSKTVEILLDALHFHVVWIPKKKQTSAL